MMRNMTYLEILEAIRQKIPFEAQHSITGKYWDRNRPLSYCVIDYNKCEFIARFESKFINLSQFGDFTTHIQDLLCEELFNMSLEEARKKYKDLKKLINKLAVVG